MNTWEPIIHTHVTGSRLEINGYVAEVTTPLSEIRRDWKLCIKNENTVIFQQSDIQSEAHGKMIAEMKLGLA